MKKVLKIVFFTLIGLIVLLVLLNPNTASFKNYAHDLGDPHYTIYKREANYFLFSIYLKDAGDGIQKYYGFAGNFFRAADDEQRRMARERQLAKTDSVIVTPTIDTFLNYGPNAHIWMDSLGIYIAQNPKATDEEVFRKFPQLNNDEKRFEIALAYNFAKKTKKWTED